MAVLTECCRAERPAGCERPASAGPEGHGPDGQQGCRQPGRHRAGTSTPRVSSVVELSASEHVQGRSNAVLPAARRPAQGFVDRVLDGGRTKLSARRVEHLLIQIHQVLRHPPQYRQLFAIYSCSVRIYGGGEEFSLGYRRSGAIGLSVRFPSTLSVVLRRTPMMTAANFRERTTGFEPATLTLAR